MKTTLFHSPEGVKAPSVSLERSDDLKKAIHDSREVVACAETLTVWERAKSLSPCAWRKLPFNEWGNVAAVNVKRKYYSCQTEHPSRAQFRDPIDALKIGISTFFEKVKRFFSGKDLFFLSKNIKRQAKENVTDGIKFCKTENKTERGGFVRRGHAYLDILIKDSNDQPLRIAVDPSVNKLGPGYRNQLDPIVPEGLENTDIVLISHAHRDHFLDAASFYNLKWKKTPRTLIQRAIQKVGQSVRRLFRRAPPAEATSVRTRLVFPAGSEQIDSLFNNSLKNLCTKASNEEDDRLVGMPVDAFVPYEIKNAAGHTEATLVAVPTKHWAGTNPITNLHKAPGFGYILMTPKECIFDAGDTGYSEEMYNAVASIVAMNPHDGGPKHITALFSPSGPDFNRKHMEKTHQATIDTARAMWKVQLLPLAKEGNDQNKTDLLRSAMQNECHQIHWGHYKLGPIHYEDPWVCWLDLLNFMTDESRHLKDIGSGVENLSGSLKSPEYCATRQAVLNTFEEGATTITPLLKEGETWGDDDTIKVILKTLLTQVAPNHETAFGHPQHAMVIEKLLTCYDKIQLNKFTTESLAAWFFTHPDDRTSEQFDSLFCRDLDRGGVELVETV